MEPSEIAENFFKSLRRAELLMDVGRWREAIHEYNQHLTSFPESYTAYCNIARCYLELTEYQSALDVTKRAVAIGPDEEWAYRLRSTIFIANGEPRRALDEAKLCVEKEPGSPSAIECLFWAQAGYGALDDAEKSLSRMQELAAGNSDTHEAAGYLALKQGKHADAEKHYLTALQIDPESINVLNNLGVVYLNLAQSGKGRHYQTKSIEMFERAVKLKPTFTLGQRNIAHASNALKVGAPAGLFFLVWMGLRVASSATSSIDGSNTHVTDSLAILSGSSYLLSGTNFYFFVIFVMSMGAALSCFSQQYREAILYKLVTVRGWLAITSAYGLASILYVIAFWVLGNKATSFSAAGFGISLLLLFFSLVNLARVWAARNR